MKDSLANPIPKLHTVEMAITFIGTEDNTVRRKSGIGITMLNAAIQRGEDGVAEEIKYQAGKMIGELIRDWKFKYGELTVLPETKL